MYRILRLAIVPAIVIGCTGCGGGMTMDAAQRLENGNDAQSALSNYEAAIKENPKLGAAYRGKARCLLKLGQAKEAEQAYRDGVHAAPTDMDLKLDLASELEGRKNLVEAKIQYDEAYLLSPKNTTVLLGQAKVHEDLGEFGAAVAKYKEAITLDPNNIDIHTRLAHTYGLLNQFDEAKKELAEVDKIKLQPKSSK
jgi:tetratricopeptide (TPR) repeat protein